MSSCAEILLNERSQVINYLNTEGGVFTTADAFASTSIYQKLADKGITFEKIE